MYVCVYVYVCVCVCVHVCTLVPDHCGGDQVGSLMLVLQANNGDLSCMHIIQCARCMVLVPEPGLLTQVPTIIHDPSTLLGFSCLA